MWPRAAAEEPMEAREVARPGGAVLDRLAARAGAAALAGEWLGGRGTWWLLWPAADVRLPSGRGGDLPGLLDALDRSAVLDERTGRGARSPGPDGWLVAVSYDAGRRFERWPRRLAVRPEVPDLVLVRHRGGLFVPDEPGSSARLVGPASELDGRREALRRSGSAAPPSGRRRLPRLPSVPGASPGVGSDFDADRFQRGVEAIRRGIGRGAFYQVNLTRRFRAAMPAGESAASLFRALRRRHAAPRGVLLELGEGRAVVSNSPELFLVADFRERLLRTAPIKGTARRGRGGAVDGTRRRELLGSAKDAAEHLMIVDLLRNDLGRVAAPGSVEVPRFRTILSTPKVHHLVSEVTARMADGVAPGAVLAATFPGGSITGAPKIAAMAAIERLETVRRGFYCGALGFYDRPSRRLELSVAIRTGFVDGGSVDFHAGGGIVADSDPREEWDEGNWKAEEFFDCLGAARRDR